MSGWLDRWFPKMPDFGALLAEQAAQTEHAIGELARMAEAGELDLGALEEVEREADALRAQNRRTLNEAFATAYDREDIQRAIEEMDWIVSHTMATAREMTVLEVASDDAIRELLAIVKDGTAALRRGLEQLDADPAAAAESIALARETDRRARARYEAALAAVFALGDPIEVLKRREIYHHLTDSAKRVHKASIVLDAIRVKNV